VDKRRFAGGEGRRMADFEDANLGMAGDAGAHPAGVVVGTTGYITTGAGFSKEDDPGSATPGIRPMTGGEREVWEGKVAGEAAGQEADAAGVRQCRQVKENGFRCKCIPAAGETFCHQHRRFRVTHGGREIEVPLMEDAASIRLVISQTVRTMGRGDIPPANGRAMIAGCREALALLQYELAKARLEEKRAERLERAAALAEVGTAAGVVAAPVAVEVADPVGVEVPVAVAAETDEEPAQEVLEVQEDPAEAEDVAEVGEAAPLRRSADPAFTETALQKQWDRGMGGLEAKAAKLQTRHSWEKKVKLGVGWPRPGSVR
jgi:hypothetical protein